MEIYKNDDRILKLWIKLAESFPESGFAVMEFAFTKGSCRQMASFYIQWSNMYQAVGWWNRAREKLQLGIKMCATPLPSIYTARDELEATALRVSLKESQDSDSDEGEPEAFGAGSNRKTLGMLRALGRRKMAPIFRHPQGPPGKIAKTPMTPAQKSFEVFMDPTPEANIKVNSTVKKGNRIADELRDDPDYQALFGFFDDREKIDLQLTNEENMSKSSRKMAQCKAPSILVTPIEEPCYEVYGDEDNHTEQSKAPKARLMLKKILVKNSIEEEYAFRLYPKVR
ncbi:mad3/BUB1 homology region 1 domain-containing protein [Ditylenchus destructor]|uniref:Mad3/BUB1 homology region 1 domain-containing protein n=1 Tax=Ditylenchus destructor TaxID=166010 RepID=A0AAD4R828_9BILA|nr:mad3/BUB1 homology region 1 domain-containing protein [Ditylenchus destructor]